MRILQLERDSLSQYAPGLDAGLRELGLHALEKTSEPGIALFRQAQAARLLIPKAYGGIGASALDALRFQIALGSRAPSLAISTTMHHYKIAALAQMAKYQDMSALLTHLSDNNCLVASGGAEGVPGQSLFSPTMIARDSGNGIVVSGTKKPCCLAWSMDILSVMIASSPDSKYEGELLNVLIDAQHPSIKRTAIWSNNILSAAESGAITLEDTPVEATRIFRLGTADKAKPFTVATFLWFELLATGTYFGMVLGLVEIMMKENKGTLEQRADMMIRYDVLSTALESVAGSLDQGILTDELLARLLNIRYMAQKFIAAIGSECLEILGGLAFARSAQVGVLLLSSRALAFHPPSYGNMYPNIAQQLDGGALVLA